MNKHRLQAFADMGGTTTHDGLAVHLDVVTLTKSLFKETEAISCSLSVLVLKVGIDKANGHKGQALTLLGVTANPIQTAHSNSARATKVAGLYEGASDDAKYIQ